METLEFAVYVILAMISCFASGFLAVAIYTYRRGGKLYDIEVALNREVRAFLCEIEDSALEEWFLFAIFSFLLGAICGPYWFLKYSLFPLHVIEMLDRR